MRVALTITTCHTQFCVPNHQLLILNSAMINHGTAHVQSNNTTCRRDVFNVSEAHLD